MSINSFEMLQTYAKSKFAGLLIAFEMARLFENKCGPISVALHPGVVRTSLSRHSNIFKRILFNLALRIFGKSPYQGAQTVCFN